MAEVECCRVQEGEWQFPGSIASTYVLSICNESHSINGTCLSGHVHDGRGRCLRAPCLPPTPRPAHDSASNTRPERSKDHMSARKSSLVMSVVPLPTRHQPSNPTRLRQRRVSLLNTRPTAFNKSRTKYPNHFRGLRPSSGPSQEFARVPARPLGASSISTTCT